MKKLKTALVPCTMSGLKADKAYSYSSWATQRCPFHTNFILFHTAPALSLLLYLKELKVILQRIWRNPSAFKSSNKDYSIMH